MFFLALRRDVAVNNDKRFDAGELHEIISNLEDHILYVN